MMKTLFFAIVGLLCLSTVATAELSVEDTIKAQAIEIQVLREKIESLEKLLS